MNGCKASDTPNDPNQKLGDNKQEDPVDISQYQKLVGKLIYLTHKWPNITFEVGVVSHFMHFSREKHLEAISHILKYFKSAPRKCWFF